MGILILCGIIRIVFYYYIILYYLIYMITPELIQFVKNEIASGAMKESIIRKLKTEGWTDLDATEAFNSISQTSSADSVKQENNIVKSFFAKFSRKNLIITVIIALVVIVVAGIAVFASGYFLSFEKVLTRSVQSLQKSKGGEFELHVKTDTSNMKIAEDTLILVPSISGISSLDLLGSYNFEDKENLKADTLVTFKLGTVEGGVNIRAIGNLLYLNLTKAPDLGFFSLKPFENKWISYEYKTEANKSSDSPQIDSGLLMDMTDDQTQHIYDMTKNASFIKMTKKHFPVSIDGSLTFHFDFDLDRQGIINYVKDLTGYLKSIDKNNLQLPETDMAQYNKIFESLKTFHGEAWIGVFDSLPHKISTDIEIINPENPEAGSTNFSSIFIYKNSKTPKIIEAPASSVSFESLISSVFGESSSIFEAPIIN